MKSQNQPPAGEPRPAPRVSVVMCTHNGSRYIDQAIRSIRDQTLADLELVVVDDGSTDTTPEVVARHAAEDPRVRSLRVEHGGVAEGRNRGMEHALSRWVALMDDDDVAAPERLERQLRFLEANPDVRALGSWAWQMGATGRRVSASDTGPTTREELADLRATGKGVYLTTSTVMLDRDVTLGMGGFRQWTFPAEDIDLWMRLSDDGIVLALPERLLDYRVHATSITATRFVDQQRGILLARENARRRLAGLPELTPEAHRSVLAGEGPWTRFQRARIWRARYLYRLGGMRIVDQRLSGFLWLAAAAVLAPGMVVGRLRRQVTRGPAAGRST